MPPALPAILQGPVAALMLSNRTEPIPQLPQCPRNTTTYPHTSTPVGGFPAGYQSKVGVGIGNANPDCEGGLRPMNKGPDGLAAPIGTGVGPGLVPPPLLRPGTSLAAHAQPRLMAAGGLGSRPGTAGSTAAVANGSLPTGRLTADSSKLLKRLK